MDGLAVAAAVIQFVEFTSSLIAKSIAIHSSATGLAGEYDELETITSSLSQSSDEIKESLAKQRGQRPLTGNERDLEKIAVDCQGVSDELLEVLASLASKRPRTKWRSFRHALRAIWNEPKVQSLEHRLDRFRQQMMSNVLNSLRQEADRSIREQSSMRESVERIEQLQRDSIPVGDRFVRQIMDGEQWRRDLIHMIHEQGQGEPAKLANLTQLKDDEGWAPHAVVLQEKRIRERILHKLAFRNMTDRERRISKAYRRTFEWIFRDPKSDYRPWASFKDFLQHPSKEIYWITGKPGSGKSTLMKYIRHHPETTNLLRSWSGDNEVIRAAFYFWNSGSHMQMSVGGLLQTVLHDCLRQLPEFVQKVLPERWEAAILFDVDDFPWSWEEVAQALKRLIMEVCPEKKFFVMIDGLDECSGSQAKLLDFISELAEDTENLKLCVASRPWNNFEDAFRNRPSLMLQDLSATDIQCFINSKFTANEGFAEFQVRDSSRAKNLLETISRKAEGVFLWVHLVVQSLLEGLTNGDGLQDIHRRLEELPPNLEDLYANILENLDDKYLDHASRLFQIVRACDDSPTLLRVALADLEDSEQAMNGLVKPMSKREKSALCKNMKRKLASRCRGLLDISSPALKLTDDSQPVLEATTNEDVVWPQADEVECDVSGAFMADLEVQYLHRSVRDYIHSSEVWSWLISANEEPFDPHLLLLKSHLLHLKSLQPSSLSAQEMIFHIWMAIKYAKRSLGIHTKKKTKSVTEVVLLLDEVDKTTTQLTSSPSRQNSTFTDRSGALHGDHWASFFLIRVSDPSFLHVMAVCGVHQYIEMRLRNSDLKEEEKKSYQNDNNGSERTPLMITALEGAPSVPEMQGYHDLFGPHTKVLKTLLQKGEDCHKRYHGRSAWDLAKNSGFAEILELFEEFKGKPSSLQSGNGNSSPTMREYREENESDNESNASTEALTGMEAPSDTSVTRKRWSRGSRVNFTNNAEALPSSMPPDNDVRSRNPTRSRDQSYRSSPWQTPAELSQYMVHQPRPSQPQRGTLISSPPMPQPSSTRSYEFPFQSPYYSIWPYNDDGNYGEYYRRRPYHQGHYPHHPPPGRPVSYWRGTHSGMLMHTIPPRSWYRSMYLPQTTYHTEQLPHDFYRNGWVGEPPLITRRTPRRDYE